MAQYLNQIITVDEHCSLILAKLRYYVFCGCNVSFLLQSLEVVLPITNRADISRRVNEVENISEIKIKIIGNFAFH